jgi:hypothetical protein
MGRQVGASQLAASAGLISAPELQATSVAVTGPLRSLLPEGVAPGSTVAVTGSAGLALALAASVAGTDRWVAGIGWGSVGLMAARELGLCWDRFVLIEPGDCGSWPTAVTAALDAFDIVAVRPPVPVSERDVRRLMARARERHTLLVAVEAARERRGGWLMADVRLQATGRLWEGLGDGHGYLRRRRLTVEATGRGRLSQGRRLELWLPGTNGQVLDGQAAGSLSVTVGEPDGTGRRDRAVS